MSLRITQRQDLSFLFSGMNQTNGAGGLSSLLGDYSSIKNGSYGKLMRAYYSENKSDAVNQLGKQAKKSAVSKEEEKALTKLQSTTDSLKDTADALLATGEKDLFAKKDVVTKDEAGNETTSKAYDTDGIYAAVNKFVADYNSVVKAGADSGSQAVGMRVDNMVNYTALQTKRLGQIGITVNSDNTLSINKDSFMKADMGSVKNVFQGSGSFGYQTSAQASLIHYAASSAATKNSTYTAGGNYTNMAQGNLFNTYF